MKLNRARNLKSRLLKLIRDAEHLARESAGGRLNKSFAQDQVHAMVYEIGAGFRALAAAKRRGEISLAEGVLIGAKLNKPFKALNAALEKAEFGEPESRG